jgi:hypothetical protein
MQLFKLGFWKGVAFCLGGAALGALIGVGGGVLIGNHYVDDGPGGGVLPILIVFLSVVSASLVGLVGGFLYYVWRLNRQRGPETGRAAMSDT